ncbi:MAG TPA: hypothetical protein VK988_20710 [Acidimicrobiales bacterium]|nr:hypothetical protein [Acidimicrobiales bacterium]
MLLPRHRRQPPFVGEASAGQLSCGQTLTTNPTLDSNVGLCSWPGIIVGADNITLNLNGFEVFGVPTLFTKDLPRLIPER